MNLILYQPDIPQNMGAMLRLAACLGGIGVEVIEPAGFLLDDRRLDRVVMDYRRLVQVTRHQSWTAFQAQRPSGSRLVLLTTKGAEIYTDFAFRESDQLMVGQESCGVPTYVAEACDARIVIPMQKGARSLNVAMAAAIALAEARRQLLRIQ